MMTRNFWPVLGTVCFAGATGLYLLHLWSGIVGRQDSDFVEEAQASLAMHDAYAKQIHRLETNQRIHTVLITRWRGVADTASSDSAKVLALKSAIHECETALLACSERAVLAEARVRELEPLLQRGVAIVDCHILGVGFLPKCLSRSASLVVGATAGILGTLVLSR